MNENNQRFIHGDVMKGQSVCTSEPFLHLWRLFACGWFLLPLSPLSPSDSSEPSVSVTKQWKPSAGQRFNKPRSRGLCLKYSILILNGFFIFILNFRKKFTFVARGDGNAWTQPERDIFTPFKHWSWMTTRQMFREIFVLQAKQKLAF